MRTIAICDAASKAAYDGPLAHAAFTDQHWVLSSEVAQKLDEPIQFLLAANQRLSLVHQIAEIRLELFEHGRPALHLDCFLRPPRKFFADLAQSEAPFHQDLCCEAFLLAQQPKEQVLGANVLVGVALRFDRGRKALPHSGLALDLSSNSRGCGAQESIAQCFVFADDPQKQVLGLDVGRTKLRCFITCEENNPTSFFRVSLKHGQPPRKGEV